MATVAITVILLIIIFYIVSRRIADPYKRALLLNAELEHQVDLRTQELKEKNQKIIDSIDYAQRIQEAMLPAPGEIVRVLKEHFVLWKPRDTVGGDFYWAKDLGHGRLVIIGDCTGHGVPGALMTMAVISMIDHIVTNTVSDDPALIIKELNRLLYQTLLGDDGQKRLDEGLDAGVCYIARDGNFLFSGAKIALYQVSSKGLHVYPGGKRGIGHRRNPERLVVENQAVVYEEGDAFYLSTDGYWDQNDAEKNHSFGTKRYRNLLAETNTLHMAEQAQVFERELSSYMQGEDQRDDITVLGFRL
jgi:serine phosphatase RsbU (regulator of sigma subunit)